MTRNEFIAYVVHMYHGILLLGRYKVYTAVHGGENFLQLPVQCMHFCLKPQNTCGKVAVALTMQKNVPLCCKLSADAVLSTL